MAHKISVNQNYQNLARGVNVPDPVAPGDMANRRFIDEALDRRASKQPARAASTGNESLVSASAVLDGVTLAPGDRILLKDQTLPAQNGLYVWTGAGQPLVRTTDFDDAFSILPGSTVSVAEGTANAESFWQLATDAPISVDVSPLVFVTLQTTYTNPAATPTTIGGIPSGSTFAGRTMQQMWDALLYPYQYPAFTSFAISGQGTTKEVGDTIPASVTFTWSTSNSANVTPNTIQINDVTGSAVLVTGSANDGSQAITLAGSITKTTATSHVFSIQATNSLSGSFSGNLTFNWRWRMFYGPNVNPTLSAAQVQGLASSQLATGFSGTYNYAAGGYKYICTVHAMGGQINSVKDQSTSFSVPMATAADNAAYSNVDGGGFSYALVSGTQNGVAVQFRVYRTRFVLGGAIVLVVT